MDKINLDFSPFEEVCLNCSAKMITYTGLHSKVVNCSVCNKDHHRSISGKLESSEKTIKSKRNSKNHLKPILPLHSKFKYRDLDWMVVGIIQKEERDFTTWFEYAVFSPKVGIEYISQFNFHFTWHRPLYGYDSIMLSKNIIDFEKDEYRKFHKYSCNIRQCWGEWPNLLVLESDYIFTEYVSPPKSLSIIESNDEHFVLKGTYLPWKEVKGLFPDINYLPRPIGTASNQPIFLQNDKEKFWSLFVYSALLLCLIQLIIAIIDPSDSLIYETAVPLKNKQEFVSSEFEIDGKAGIVDVSVFADISNSWIYYDAFIVNEKTGEQFGFSDETEMYSGYTDGESWVEGSRTLEKTLTGVPAGTYRFVVQPEFATTPKPGESIAFTLDDGKSADPSVLVEIRIYRVHYSMFNFWLTLLIMFVPFVSLSYYRYSKEKSRWMNSNYYSDYYDEN